MNALMSSRPRRGSCSEYLSSMSGAAISSTTPRLTLLPQNSVNHRPTTALLSSSLLMKFLLIQSCEDHRTHFDNLGQAIRARPFRQTPVLALKSEEGRFACRPA